jgi:hypothetical protein
MNNQDFQRLADLRLQFHLGLEMSHVEIAEMLRLQSKEYQQLGGIGLLPSEPMTDLPPEMGLPPAIIPIPPPWRRPSL